MISSVSMAKQSRAYVYDCCGATKTSQHLNLLVTYEKNFAESKKTQEQSYELEFVSYNSMSS